MPVPSNDRFAAAFARVADARYAIDILESCGLAPIDIDIETVTDERGAVQLVILRIVIAGEARDRVLAAISGGHGVPLAPADGAQPSSASSATPSTSTPPARVA
jgi:hypothetical protein